MKRISILLLAVLLFTLSLAQVSQFPQVYYYGADSGNPELIIHSSNSSSSSAITELSLTAKIGADALFTNSSDPYEMNWVRVSLPSTSSSNNSPNYGYLRCNEFYGKINSTNNYATVNTTSTPLGVRTCAGCTSTYVTSGGQSIWYGKNSILALTGSTSSGWYEIYLPNGTGGYPMAFSQPTGWVNGQYLSFPSSQSYKIIGGRVCNGSGNCTIIGNVNQATITYSGLGTTRSGSGSYEYKVPTNWNGTLTCSHPSYNTSSPTSISVFASNHNYSNNFLMSNTTPCTTPNAPTISSCSGASTNSFTANWSSVVGATKYYLDVSTNSSFSPLLLNYSNLDVGNVLTKSVTGLNSNTTYYYRVRVYTCALSTNSSYSTCQTTTSCTTPNAPTISSCSGANTNSFTANWSSVAGATKYYLDVSTNSSFSPLLPNYSNLDVGNVLTKSVTGLNANTTYYYRVRVYTCALSTNSSYSTCQTTSSCTTPNAPTLATCSGVSTNSFTANWSSVVGATKYYLDVSTNSSFSSFVGIYSSYDVGNVLTKSVTGLNANTTYYYRVRVYTCALSGNSSSGYCLTTSNIPSQITINNIIKNNTRFTNPKLLWTGNTTQTPDIIKICADASNSTEITFINNTGINSNNLRFLIASDIPGNNSDKSGYFIRDTDNLSIIGNTIKAKYTHPKYLEPQFKPSRPDSIIIVDVNNSNIRLFSIPIQIYRAPVIMVHGFTGGGSDESFYTTRSYLINTDYYTTYTGNYNDFLHVVDYHYDSYKKFETNQFVIPFAINYVFNQLRANNVSVGKVDLVGFSMGGCLSRIYLQSDPYIDKQDIHKLITINTPHFGSQWGNLFTNTRTRPVVYPLIRAKIFFDLGLVDIEENLGAIYDLSVNSQAMNKMNTIPNLNKSTVPTHTLGTTITDVSLTNSLYNGQWNDFFYYKVLRAICRVSTLSFSNCVSDLFINGENDGAVRLNSQSGGLSGLNFSQYPDQFHLGANKNSYIMNELSIALNINSSNTNYFTQTGVIPTVQESNYRLAQPNTSTESEIIQQGFISINFPISGQYFVRNAVIPINITSSNGINRILFTSISNSGSDVIIDTLFSNGNINFNVPANAFGKISFVVIGNNNNDFIDYDTVTININQTASLDSIISYSTPLYLQALNTEAVTLKAYFNDGYDYIVKNNDGVEYTLADTTIAKYFYGNLIYGKKKGNTSLSVKYKNKTISIPVYVTDRDTTIPPLNISSIISAIPMNKNFNVDKLKIYPNPNSGLFTIEFESLSNVENELTIFNNIGQQVYFEKLKKVTGKQTKVIDIKNMTKGIYHVQIKSGRDISIQKIVIN